MDIERRLKDHLAESGDRIDVTSDGPMDIMNARQPRSGKVVQVVTAVLLVAMAGGGFWMLSGEEDGVTEIAAGDLEEADEEPSDNSADGTGDGTGDGSGVTPASIDLEFVDITSDLSPSGGQVVIDGDVYYLLSTAPGRVKIDWNTQNEEEIFELMRPNSFYVYEESSGWAVSTVEDRFVSDFDVKDGVLYVISTGSVNGSQASVGVSTDQGKSWDWKDTDSLPEAHQVTIMATNDQPLIFGSRWGNANYEDAIELASSVGIELSPMALYNVDGIGFTYVPLDDENRCDFVLGQFLPGLIDMRDHAIEFEEGMGDEDIARMQEDELRWIGEEVKANGCSLPENIDELTFEGLPAMPEPITKTWEGLGVSTPESWKPWAGLYRFNGDNLEPLDLPYGPEVQTGYATEANDRLTITVFERVDYTGDEPLEGPEGETVYFTTDGENWTEEFRKFPQTEEEYAAQAWIYEDGGYLPPVIGDKTYRLWWDEEAFVQEPVNEEDWVEPTPELQVKTGDGEWENLSLGDLVGDTEIGDRQLWEVRGSSVGVFLIFGPRWDEANGTQTEESQIALYSSNGKDWESVEFAGQNVQFVNAGSKMLLFATDYDHDDGNYSVTESYLVRPKG